MELVKKEIVKIIPKKSKIVLANSAGPDSMALFDVLLKLRNEFEYEIICAHVNHGVRKESVLEAEALKEICKKNNVVFETMKIEEPILGNFHEEARRIRYSFFESILKNHSAQYLLTAHHSDDLVETILFKLTRGSSLKGMHGFVKLNEFDKYTLFRPLIIKTKEDILKYCESENITYFKDSSNESDAYTRNRIRNNIIPILKKENPKLNESISRYSEEIYNAALIVDEVIAKMFNDLAKDNCILLDKYNSIDEKYKKFILMRFFEINYGEHIDLITNQNLIELEKIIASDKPNVISKFPGDKYLIKEYSNLYFTNEINDSFEEVVFEEEFSNEFIDISFVSSDSNDNVIRLSSEEIKLPLKIRNRSIGDKIEVSESGKLKKVKDIFIEKKIPITERNEILLVLDSNDKVLFIPGVYNSIYCKKNNEKYDIILKYTIKK